MTIYRMSLIRHRRRTFLLCKETGKQKWAGMLAETGKAFVDPSAMMIQMREDSDFWSLPLFNILCWQAFLVITKPREDGPGITQMDTTTTRLITFSEEALPIRTEPWQNTKFFRSRHWKWARLADPFAFAWKESTSQNTQGSCLTSKNWKIPMCWKSSKPW